MDETARKFEEAIGWLREQGALTDDVRAQFAEMLPWLPKSAQDGLWNLAKRPAPVKAAPRWDDRYAT